MIESFKYTTIQDAKLEFQILNINIISLFRISSMILNSSNLALFLDKFLEVIEILCNLVYYNTIIVMFIGGNITFNTILYFLSSFIILIKTRFSDNLILVMNEN